MKNKVILIVMGEPYSTFSEIVGKFFSKKRNFKFKIVLIGNYDLIKNQTNKLGYNFKINKIDNVSEAKKGLINLINIDFKYKKLFSKISDKSNKYIRESFNKSLEIIKSDNNNVYTLINGPISKKTFLQRNYLGITEYLSEKTNSFNEVMLIYNDKLSVSPLTTHIPLKKVPKHITKNKIINSTLRIENFYKKLIKKKPKFAILGLNPHCETTDKFSEESKIISPSINVLKRKNIKIEGPFSADTFFLQKNINKYDVVIGMYHDQVLTPIKTLFNFNAINITIGLPFIRISPDHGPNSEMLGKNLSDSSSIRYALKFIEKYV